MIAPPLVLALLLAAPPGAESAPAAAADPAELAAKLGAPSFADREAATAALRDLGDAALPALRAAIHAKDAEVRTRAAALAAEIETGRMLRPTRIALHYKDRPLEEILKDFGNQAGVEVILQPMGFPNPAQARRITLEAPGTVPFWTAVDKLTAAAQLQFNPNWIQPTGRPTFHLMQGYGPMLGRNADGGPFRVTLQSLQHTRSVNPTPGPADAPVNDMFMAQLFVAAEPRLQLFQAGPARIDEAADDLGHSLMIPEIGPNSNHQMFFHNNGVRGFNVHAMLKYPERPGKRIKALRGGVPVTVTSRKADPLEVRLAEAAGKTYKVDGGDAGGQEGRGQRLGLPPGSRPADHGPRRAGCDRGPPELRPRPVVCRDRRRPGPGRPHLRQRRDVGQQPGPPDGHAQRHAGRRGRAGSAPLLRPAPHHRDRGLRLHRPHDALTRRPDPTRPRACCPAAE